MKKMNRQETGEYFNQWRRSNFKTQRDCADYFGIKAPYVSQVELGVRWPTPAMLEAIGGVLTTESYVTLKKGNNMTFTKIDKEMKRIDKREYSRFPVGLVADLKTVKKAVRVKK